MKNEQQIEIIKHIQECKKYLSLEDDVLFYLRHKKEIDIIEKSVSILEEILKLLIKSINDKS